MDTHWNRLVEAVLTSTHSLYFEQNYEKYQKKYQNYLSENFRFLAVKFSVYLNRRVFVMEQSRERNDKQSRVILLMRWGFFFLFQSKSINIFFYFSKKTYVVRIH